jgi:PhnB protein
MKIRTFLNYGGNCAEAFSFYEKHLGGKIVAMMKHDEAPTSGATQDGAVKGILYARLVIGDNYIMASDVPSNRFERMRSAYLSLSVDSDAEAERIYGLLSEGGEIYMPMQETFFASRFGQLRDRFGTSWMVIHEKPMPGSEQ